VTLTKCHFIGGALDGQDKDLDGCPAYISFPVASGDGWKAERYERREFRAMGERFAPYLLAGLDEKVALAKAKAWAWGAPMFPDLHVWRVDRNDRGDFVVRVHPEQQGFEVPHFLVIDTQHPGDTRERTAALEIHLRFNATERSQAKAFFEQAQMEVAVG
jgi:hypothetical protein